MNISGVIYESLVDGTGVRTTIFISGCKHNCKGCHNPEVQDFNNGVPFTIERQKEVIQKIKNNPLIQGITLSGGDPIYSTKDVLSFIKLLLQEIPNLNIWFYTGFTYEELIKMDDKYINALLLYIDVLVDGRYEESQKDLTIPFRGSKNQRIINIMESLMQDKIVLAKI